MRSLFSTRTPAFLLAAAVLAAAVAGCDALLSPPADAPARLAVSYVLTPGDPSAQVGAERAFDRVDRLRVRLMRGEEVAFDESFPVSGTSGEIRQSVTVDLERNEEEMQLEVELAAGTSPVFEGSETVLLVAGEESSREVPLDPVPATLNILPVATFPSLGDSTRASAVVLFATGDTVDGAPVVWTGPDPGIMEVRPDGWAIARGEGQARLVATAGDLRQEVTVQVRATPVSLRVQPDSAMVMRADTIRFQAIVEDARGNVLVRNVVWTTFPSSIASVNASGLVTPLVPGEAKVHAKLDVLADSGKLYVFPRRGELVPRVASALDNAPIAGAVLQVRRGANADLADSVIANAATDGSGHTRLSLEEGPYTVTVTRSGFIEETIYNLVVVPDQENLRNIVISPIVPPGQTRIVLTWGADPEDLDPHFTGPDSLGGTFHVYYSNPGSDSTLPYVQLDTDDTDGYGPETITVYRQLAGDYCLSVHLYSGTGTLGSSQALVRVFRGNQEIASFTPAPTMTARVWTVFKMNGSQIFPINTTASSPPGICSAPPVNTDARPAPAPPRLPGKN